MQQYLQNSTRMRNAMQLVAPPLERDPRWDASTFGPSFPLVSEPLDDPTGLRPDGQPTPRLYEYPVAWNTTIGREQHVQWATLRRSAELPIFRACIELRKTELSTMEWGIRVSPKIASRRAAEHGEKSAEQMADEMRKEHQDSIDKLEQFWQVPDRKNGRNFSEWIALAADEQLTHDALAVYPHQTYGGDTLGFWLLDGSTIMPLLDETGGRPAPPLVAYQQILYGFPRGEFTAQTYANEDGKLVVPNGFSQGQLVYRRRTPRTTTPYGYSATEQALLDGLLYNKRFGWMVNNYTDGVLPQAYMESTDMSWTPEQLLDYERDFNQRMAGMTAERMRVPFLPPGMKATQIKDAAQNFGTDYDLYLVKLVCMHFGITASELGFNDSGGLGSQGYHEGQEDINYRRGRLPDLRWFSDLCTELSISYLGMPPELEFYFLGLESEDEAAADALMSQRVQDGRITLNEARASLGYRPYGFKEANEAMLQTERGVVFLDGSSEMAPAGTLVEPLSQNNIVPGIGNGTGAGTGPSTQGTAKSPAAQAKTQAQKDRLDFAVLKAEEVLAYSKYCSKGSRNRGFNWVYHTEDEALAISQASNAERTLEARKAADAAPKAPIRNWSLYTQLD